MRTLTLLFTLFSINTYAQKTEVFRIDSIPEQGVLLDKGWKWHAGDNPDFAKADFDDSAWQSIEPTKDIMDLAQISKEGQIGWFRLRLSLDESLLNKQISLVIQQTGASEIYLNGLKIVTNGIIDKDKIVAKDPLWKPFPVNLHDGKQQVIAVKFALQPNILYTAIFENYNPAFWINVMDSEKSVAFHYAVTSRNLIFIFLIIGISLMIFIIHYSFYLLYPDQKANLYFSLFSLFFLLGSLSQYFYWLQPFQLSYKFYLGNLAFLLFIIGYFFLLTAAYLFLEKKKDFLYYFLTIFSIIAVFLNAYPYGIGWQFGGPMQELFIQINIARIAVIAVRKKQKGSWIIAIGAFSTLVVFIIFLSQGTFTNTSFLLSLPVKRMIFYMLFCLSLPISTSLFLAFQFADISKGLKRKIIENETLSDEKQQILSTQNETLEKQVTERTAELVHKNRDLEIEASLERIRSHSMALQKSTDLEEVIKVVFAEWKKLGLDLFESNINIVDNDNKAMTIWSYGLGYTDSIKGTRFQFFDHPFLIQFIKDFRNQTQYSIIEMSGENNKDYLRKAFSETDFKYAPEEYKQAAFAIDKVFISNAYIKFGSMDVISLEPLPNDKAEILIRFAKVFEQTYTRFLDLQKAEAQAREATIEVALEMIRSRSLAMHSSEELKEVMAVMFAKMTELDVLMGTIAVQIFDEKTMSCEFWLGSKLLAPTLVRLPFDKSIMEEDNYMKHCWEAKVKGESFFNKLYSFEQKKPYFEYVFSHNDENIVPPNVKEFLMEAPNQICCLIIEKNSSLFVDSWEGQDYSEDKIDVLKRVAKVFEQAYIRFLDLQKAETQAREAQIESALEKVRSRSLAMHKSDELKEVIQILLKQLIKLNFKIDSVQFDLNYKKSADFDLWTAVPGQSYPFKLHIPYWDHPFLNQKRDAEKNSLDFSVANYTFEEKNLHFQHVFQHNPWIPEERRTYLLNCPGMAVSAVLLKTISLWAGNYNGTPFSDEENVVLKRFAKVFEQSYTRFIDLQKAEDQARESQIQLAMERVRARTMAMQHSDELADASFILDCQVRALGIKTRGCGFNIYGENESTEWFSSETGTMPTYKTPREKVFLRYYQEGQDGKQLYIESFEGDACAAHYDYLCTLPVTGEALKKFKEDGGSFPTQQIDHVVYFKYGYLLFITLKPAPEAHDIFIRFAKVFEQTYTRFLDLQKAEAQARESQIQLALERVRARTMAMQKSENLIEVINVVAEQLIELNFQLNTASFFLNDESEEFTFWLAAIGESNSNKIVIPKLNHPVLNNIKEAQRNGLDFFADSLTFEEKNTWFQHVFDHSSGRVPEDRQKYILNTEGYARSVVLMKQIGLFIVNYVPQPYTDAENAIFKRFAYSFEQAYTRFLDLQKAEAQTRESQIELGLERVRAKTMAMHKSDELKDVVGCLYEELQHLDFKYGACTITIMDKESGDMDWWIAGFGQDTYPESYHVNYFNHPCFEAQLSYWKKGEKFIGVELSGNEKKSYDEVFFSYSDFKNLPEEAKIIMTQLESVVFSMAYMKYGALTWGPEVLSVEYANILQRFAKVFEQTYTRFLDLQKAEAQARESQIEAALEKIRSRSLAMHHSDELKEVMGVMFKKLTELEILLGTVGILLFDEKTKNCDFWLQNQHQEPGIARLPYDEKMMNEDNYMRNYWNAKSKGESFFNKKESIEQKNRHFEYVFAHNDMPQPIQEYLLQAQHHTQTFIVEKNSALLVDSWDERIYSDEQIEVLKRVAKVFEQAYIRFLDLQKAEAQAREANIETALEKIRSRSLGMHNSTEIKDVVSILFEKLIELNLVFDGGAAIHLFDEVSRNAVIWVAAPDLQEPSCVNLPYDEAAFKNNPIITDVWHAKETGLNIYNKFYSFEEKNRYFDYVFKHNDYTTIPKPLRDIIIQTDSYTASFIAEKNSLLGANSWTKQLFSDNDFAVLKRIGKVFEQAYIRFLDLQKAEAQAREAQIEAAFERIRASALAMQTSEEFLGVVKTLYEQLNTLGQQELEATTIQFYDMEQGFINSWHAQNIDKLSTGNISLGSTRIPFNACELTLEWLSAYNSTKKDYTIVAKGEKLKNWLQFLVKISPEIKDRLGDSMPEISNFHFSEFSEGTLSMVSQKPFSDESKYLLKRAASAFDLAYKRYLDLQSKEEQALKLAQEKLRLEAALKELQATQVQLIQSEKLASLGELTAGIAHEIQNPLNFVNNFSEVSSELVGEMKEEMAIGNQLLANEIADNLKQNLEKITFHGKRASSIVKGMLEHSRTSTKEKELTDINVLADEYLRLSYHGLRAKDKTFNADFQLIKDESIPKIAVIPQDMGRVILNLINNAFYAAYESKKPNPMVTLTTKLITSSEGQIWVSIGVKDNGNGIPKANLEKIFQPFFTTKPTGQGTGLGLSLAYDIVTKGHGGTIEVESTEGEGTEFNVKLPI